MIKLRANDKTVLEVSAEGAKRSKFISDLLIDFKEDVIDVAEADGPTLKDVIEYLEYYKDKEPVEIDTPVEDDDRLADVVDPWDVEFCERDKDKGTDRILNLVVAADYMGIESLHDLVCLAVASDWMEIGDNEVIKEKYGIEEDMTEEEAVEFEKHWTDVYKKERDEEEKKAKDEDDAEFQRLLNEEDPEDEEEEDEGCVLDDMELEGEKKEGEGDKKEGDKIEVKEADK